MLCSRPNENNAGPIEKYSWLYSGPSAAGSITMIRSGWSLPNSSVGRVSRPKVILRLSRSGARDFEQAQKVAGRVQRKAAQSKRTNGVAVQTGGGEVQED